MADMSSKGLGAAARSTKVRGEVAEIKGGAPPPAVADAALTPELQLQTSRDTFESQLADMVASQTGRTKSQVLSCKTFQVDFAHKVKQNTITMAQMIIHDRRRDLSPEDVAASHEKVAKMGLNTVLRMSPRERAEMTVDALHIDGMQKLMVMEAVDLILAGEPVHWENMEPIGGSTSDTADTHRTQMAVTDEGHYHVLMTAIDKDMTDGAWVHLERTNRVDADGMASAEASPYAAPPLWAPRLMSFFMGSDAPRTVFFGLPNRIANAAGEALPKGADDAASAAIQHNRETLVRHAANMGENVFRWAVSEMKVQVDGMSPSEVISAMKEIHREVRPKEGQYFSGAFNLFRAATDFGIIKSPDQPLSREQMWQVAKKAIETAAEGGWKKLTLDSSRPDPTQPSQPLIEEFGSRQLFEFVHLGHITQPRGGQDGFEEYVSGGMQPFHFPLLAMTGVDGVGVGGAIHKKTALPGIMGELEPAKVKDALKRRNDNDMTSPGQVTYLLRRIDAREGSGEALTDIDRSLQKRALSLLRPLFDRIDTQMDGLKADMKARIAAAKDGGMDAGGLSTLEAKEKKDFATAFEGVITTELAEPGFVGQCQALVELAASNGYPPRTRPDQA